MKIKIEMTRKTMIKTVQRKMERKRGEYRERARVRSVWCRDTFYILEQPVNPLPAARCPLLCGLMKTFGQPKWSTTSY